MSERDLFIAALERDDPAEQEAYLAEACGGDAALLRRVKRLLLLHHDAGSFLEGPPVTPNEPAEPAGDAENAAQASQPGSVVTPDSAAAAPTTPAPPGPAPPPPTAIGRYQVRRTLGGGGFSAVYLGHDTQLDRPVAIKVLLGGVGQPQAEDEQALQEARRLARLRHPGIDA